MSRNFINLLTVAAVLFIVTACVYRSGRDSTQKNTAPNSFGSNEHEPSEVKKYSPASENKNQKKDEGDFIVEHLEIKSARLADFDRQVREDKMLEKAADKLNRALNLPRDITLRTKECGESNAFYDEKNSSVTVCYELLEHFLKVFSGEQKANDKMLDAVRFAFLHEIGHALIDVYDLPVAGNDEDAADRCSAFINLTELGDDGVNAVLAAADAFAAESKSNVRQKGNAADEHLFQEQRFYNSLCLLYGSNAGKYEYLVSENYLPKSRAEHCPAEYDRMVESWEVLLAPWRKK